MIDPQDNKRLLGDVLAEGSIASRREALLGNTLRLVRRRRRFRQARRGVYALTLVAATVLVLSRHGPPGSVQPSPARPYTLVQTQPLRQAAVVETKTLPAGSLVMSVPTLGIFTTTAAGQRLHELSDKDLLALTAANPAVLVRLPSGSAELVFVHSDRE